MKYVERASSQRGGVCSAARGGSSASPPRSDASPDQPLHRRKSRRHQPCLRGPRRRPPRCPPLPRRSTAPGRGALRSASRRQDLDPAAPRGLAPEERRTARDLLRSPGQGRLARGPHPRRRRGLGGRGARPPQAHARARSRGLVPRHLAAAGARRAPRGPPAGHPARRVRRARGSEIAAGGLRGLLQVPARAPRPHRAEAALRLRDRAQPGGPLLSGGAALQDAAEQARLAARSGRGRGARAPLREGREPLLVRGGRRGRVGADARPPLPSPAPLLAGLAGGARALGCPRPGGRRRRRGRGPGHARRQPEPARVALGRSATRGARRRIGAGQGGAGSDHRGGAGQCAPRERGAGADPGAA